MNQSFDDLSGNLPNHVGDVDGIMDALKLFHQFREETYQLSFAKRGESGVWLNLARKYDRLDPLAARVMGQVVTGGDVDNNDGVTLVDTLADTAMYALKWLAIIKTIRSDHFNKWVEEVYCRDTGLPLDKALEQFAPYLTAEDVPQHKVTPLGGFKKCRYPLRSTQLEEDGDAR